MRNGFGAEDILPYTSWAGSSVECIWYAGTGEANGIVYLSIDDLFCGRVSVCRWVDPSAGYPTDIFANMRYTVPIALHLTPSKAIGRFFQL
ncbi:MAG: hypothetical protein AB4352_08535 [Hormoscilla sp.]